MMIFSFRGLCFLCDSLMINWKKKKFVFHGGNNFSPPFIDSSAMEKKTSASTDDRFLKMLKFDCNVRCNFEANAGNGGCS